MTAPARRTAALRNELWQRATEIRREWLAIGLSTEPADRSSTEEAIASIYARHGRARPAFHWVCSPGAALPHLRDLPTHDDLRAWVADRRPAGRPPIASDIAAGLSRLRSSLDDHYTEPPADRPPPKRRDGERRPLLPPAEALDAGLPLREVLTQGVRQALSRSLAGVSLPMRRALTGERGGAPLPVGWYGNQDASWVAYHDTVHRLGLAGPGVGQEFATWTALTRAAGWWWPGEDRCVLVERPAVLLTEPVPGTWHDEVRLVRSVHPDGWAVTAA